MKNAAGVKSWGYLTFSDMIKFLYIDLFCGAGGTSTGVENARLHGEQIAKVIACVNHDANAIASHAANHPDALHFTEDIRTLDLTQLTAHVEVMRLRYAGARVVLWASLECTNFSIAKGGQSRDADSRTLAEHLFRYIEALKPDYIQIENVKEFMTWGPLAVKVVKDKKTGALMCPLSIKSEGTGKNKQWTIGPVMLPCETTKGQHYHNWVSHVKSYGYRFDYRILDAADYGAYTSRRRFFGIFASGNLPIVFPEQTHAKNPENDLFDQRAKWRPVREVLDLQDEGTSIFGRKTPLADATHERIFAGLIKFVAGGKDAFLVKYNSVNGKTGKHIPPSIDQPCPVVAAQDRLGLARACFLTKYFSGSPESKNLSVDGPAHTITAVDHHAIINARFLTKYYSGKPEHKTQSIEEPAGTIRTEDCFTVVKPEFLTAYYGNGFNSSIDGPAPTITTKDRFQLVRPQFLDMQYGNSRGASVESPAGTITTNPKHHLVTCRPWIMNPHFQNVGNSLDHPFPTITANRKWHYLMNPQYKSKGGGINTPCFTLIARMDKMPPYLITTKHEGHELPQFIRQQGHALVYEIYTSDSPAVIKIKEFMALYGLVDVKMRMLKIPELKRIMGFPANYNLIGTQAEQKKYIGNAVEVNTARVQCEALGIAIIEYERNAA